MPAEAVHLSALEDSLSRLSASAKNAVTEELYPAARLGALFVDFAYFDHFASGLMRYFLNRPPAPSPWGDAFHNRAPIRLGRELAEASVRLSRLQSTREEGKWLRAFALGYICHAAVDRTLHPMVNHLAEERAAEENDDPTRMHTEVEKFQSILFHEERLGRDFMGTAELAKYIQVPLSELSRPGIRTEALQQATKAALEQAPALGQLERWGNGFQKYQSLISGPLGKTVAPMKLKVREKARLYDRVKFRERYETAVGCSIRWMETLQDYARSGDFGSGSRSALESVMPEGTIDPPPDVTDAYFVSLRPN